MSIRKLTMALMAMAVGTTLAWGQATKRIPYDEREMHVSEIMSLEKENAHAIQLANPTFFDSTYADEFSGVNYLGEKMNKLDFVHRVQNPGVQFERVAESDINVKMYLDAASVISLRSERGSSNGKRFDRQYRVMRIYVYSPRGWKVVSQLETQLPGVARVSVSD